MQGDRHGRCGTLIMAVIVTERMATPPMGSDLAWGTPRSHFRQPATFRTLDPGRPQVESRGDIAGDLPGPPPIPRPWLSDPRSGSTRTAA